MSFGLRLDRRSGGQNSPRRPLMRGLGRPPFPPTCRITKSLPVTGMGCGRWSGLTPGDLVAADVTRRSTFGGHRDQSDRRPERTTGKLGRGEPWVDLLVRHV